MKTLILSVNILPSVSKPNIVLMLCISCTPKTSLQKIVVVAVNVHFMDKECSIHLHNVVRHFHKHAKLAIMALMLTLFSHIFVVFFIIYLDFEVLVNVKLDMSVDKGNYLSILQTLLVFLILNGTPKTKLAILAFLYCGDIMKNSII